MGEALASGDRRAGSCASRFHGSHARDSESGNSSWRRTARKIKRCPMMTESNDRQLTIDTSRRASGPRPQVLVLASDALFGHFFPEDVRARLSEIADWEQYHEREDSQRLRDLMARSDALLTTWHSPFIRRDMLGDIPRVRLIAHCGGEVK